MVPVRVRVERHGGYAGLRRSGERDVTELSPAQKQALDGLARRPAGAARPAGADRFGYVVTVIDAEGNEHRSRIAEDDMPDELAAIAGPYPVG